MIDLKSFFVNGLTVFLMYVVIGWVYPKDQLEQIHCFVIIMAVHLLMIHDRVRKLK